jgi:16S rRNA (guanine527-N7)-methyltransferase
VSARRRDALERLALGEPERERLDRFLAVLDAWTLRVNLTGARTASERVALLIQPALAASRWVLPGHLIDVGSGNGSPGMIVALVRPDVRVTLLEPRVHRWAFLREAARACGVPVTVLRQRHEQYSGDLGDTLTARALRLSPHDARRLLRPRGRWVLFHAPTEIPAGFVRGAGAHLADGVHVLEREEPTLFHDKHDGETAPPGRHVPRET